jgi:hypothetical protein
MQDTWHFVAMEYYALILNRTYLVSVGQASITGKVCRGLTAVESGTSLTRYITRQLAVHGNLNDPSSYVSDHQLSRQNNADFSFSTNDIVSVSFNPNRKWGMGHYPHDGRVIILTPEKRWEFIILGNQSGREIAGRISEITRRAA